MDLSEIGSWGRQAMMRGGMCLCLALFMLSGCKKDEGVHVPEERKELQSLRPDVKDNQPLTLVVGESAKLKILAVYRDGGQDVANVAELVFESLHPDVAMIDAEGNIRAFTAGEATIQVTHKRTGKQIVLKVSVSKAPIAELAKAFKDVQDVVFETEMTLPATKVIAGVIAESRALDMTDFVYVDDIVFERQGSDWYVSNKTHLPVGDMIVTYQGETIPTLLQLDQALPPYTRARLSLSGEVASGLKYINQKIMFHPKIQLGGNNTICIPEQTCYSSPNPGGERAAYERVLGYIHDIFNRRSFVSELDSFFTRECANYSDCQSYVEQNQNDLSYAFRHYLTLALEGHHLEMRVMRNLYRAEGVGAGSRPNLAQYSASSGGWASIWENYIDAARPEYRVLDMNTLFHEITHAYGYGHDSGWNYGFADHLAEVYFPSLRLDPTTKPVLRSADIIADYQLINGVIRINLQSKDRPYGSGKVKFRIASNKKSSFVVNYLDTADKHTIEIKFDALPPNPIYLQIWDDAATYFTTLKVDAFMLADLKIYETEGMRFMVLPPELIDKNANGWDIRKHCIRPGNRVALATKVQYESLYRHLKESQKLSELPFRDYLSADEPAGYRIWKVNFGDDEVTSTHRRMTEVIGEAHGLACVEALH